MNIITPIDQCRICHNPNLITIMDLGLHPLSSRFPGPNEPDPFSAPLVLMKCDDRNNDCCGLIQLGHNVCQNELYLNNYGYRSGLNKTMINHLTNLVKEIQDKINIECDDVVLDIGSNDSTLLRAYTNGIRVGIDPTGEQFKEYYPDNIKLLPTFFNKEVYDTFTNQKAKVITTVSMFYDLTDPISFAQNIKDILHEDGVWVSEQSYCVTMLENNSFDTICSEHLEYYTLKQFQYICDQVGLEVIDVSLNDCNGGSFRLTMAHKGKNVNDCVNKMRESEDLLNLANLHSLNEFIKRCEQGKKDTMKYLKEEKEKGKIIYLYGASTKGNTLLKYYELDKYIVTAAAEVNKAKFGCRTPGTNIPIISENQMREEKPDILLVLPWHFKKEFLEKEKDYINNGGKIIFPLPTLDIHGV